MNFAYQGHQPPAKLTAIASTNMFQGIQSQISTQSPYPTKPTCWISDSSAMDHLTPDITHMPSYQEYHGQDGVTVGNGQTLLITHFGNSILCTPSHLFLLCKILRVPSMSLNLLSVYRFCKDNNASFYFDSSKFRIRDLPTGKLLYSDLSGRGLYPICGAMLPSSSSVSSCFSVVRLPPQVWHNHLGHPHDRVLHHLLASNTHVQTVSHKFPFCTHCVESKIHKLPFTDSTSITTRPLELVHSDVWGPALVTSINEI